MTASALYQGQWFYHQWQTDQQPVVFQESRAVSKTSAIPQIESLNTDLFGAFNAQPVVKQTTLPETSLSFTLNAIIYSGSSTSSAAFVYDGEASKMYRINDVIDDEAKVVAIHPDFITLERNGQQEKLIYEQDDSGVSVKETGLGAGNQSPALNQNAGQPEYDSMTMSPEEVDRRLEKILERYRTP